MIAAWLVVSALLILVGADPLLAVIAVAVAVAGIRVVLALRANRVYLVRGRVERWP